MTRTIPFNAADHLKTDDDQRWFILDAFKSEDPAYIGRVIDVVAGVRGIAIPKAAGPAPLSVVLEVFDALGLRLTASPME